ncbi:MAG TPA: FHA domain-containing protein [Jiangellaceae bacterium]|nr:FHA domain-containing protein [Jiangellaceae bacterium]
MPAVDPSAPYLEVVSPGALHGQLVTMSRDHIVVGRGSDSDIRLNEPHVSRTHAELRRKGNEVFVQDLGSSGGTKVNGVRITESHRLDPGDVVSLATVDLVYHTGHEVNDLTNATLAGQRAQAADPHDGPGSAADYDVRDQYGRVINNVGRNQYNAYFRQRDSFLRDIAATKTKARWLVWLGLLMYVAGFALFAAGVLGFISQGVDAISSGDLGPPTDPFGESIAGIPSGLLGWALAAVGTILLVVGIVLHIVATSRRKRVEREWPLQPPPWRFVE